MKRILVVGATGTQGIPAVRALVEAGFEVHGLSRPGSAKAERLAEIGAQVAPGDLFDAASLGAAMEGMDGVVFIPPVPTSGDPVPELTVGFNVVRAAEAAGVGQIVHTSVDRAGDQASFSGWGECFGFNYRMYWLAKSWVVDLVMSSNVAVKTVLKPSLIMEDFVPPIAHAQFPLLRDGVLLTSIDPGREIRLVGAEDIGRLITRAFQEPEVFSGREIPLAGDSLTMAGIAGAISEATGKPVRSEHVTAEEFATDPRVLSSFEAIYGEAASDALAGTVQSYEWDGADGYTADVAESNGWGVRLSTFPEWCARHAADFDIA